MPPIMAKLQSAAMRGEANLQPNGPPFVLVLVLVLFLDVGRFEDEDDDENDLVSGGRRLRQRALRCLRCRTLA